MINHITSPFSLLHHYGNLIIIICVLEMSERISQETVYFSTDQSYVLVYVISINIKICSGHYQSSLKPQKKEKRHCP